jgi:hypothetical protein
MGSLGYEAKGVYGIAFRRYFQKGKNARTHNVHVYQEGDHEISRYLKFRDRMRSHIERCGWGFWAAPLIQTGEFIGFIGLEDVCC